MNTREPAQKRWARKKMKPNNLTIFDQAEREATEGMELSYRNAPSRWKVNAQKVLRELCLNQPKFNTDEFWYALDDKGINTGEPRALGAIIKGAARAGMIRKTGEFVESARRHKAPIPVWESLIYKGRP